MGRGARTAASATVRTAILLALILAVVVIPLLVVYRSECPADDGTQTRWSFVPPFDDPPAECREHRSGLEVLGDEVGL